MIAWRCAGGRPCRDAARPRPPKSSHDEPFTVIWPFLTGVDVHSNTLPAASSTPYGLAPLTYVPTGVVSPGPFTPLSSLSDSNVLPHGYARPPSPRAAFSYSPSVGHRRGWPTSLPR